MDMKKIMMFAAIAAAALSSCSNSELVDVSSGRAIGFETFVGKAGTKGVPVTESNFGTTATMEVWGYTSTTGTALTAANFDTEATPIPNLSATKVSKADNKWTYTPPAYWKANKMHTFFACAPYLTTGLSFSKGVVTYTVADDVTDQVDFMVADPKSKDWNGSDELESQTFKFHHALSRIEYSAKITENSEGVTDVQVVSVTMQKMNAAGDGVEAFANTGTISIIGKTADAVVSYQGDPTTQGTPLTDGYKVQPTTPVSLGNYVSDSDPAYASIKHATEDILMIMPQATTTKVQFTIALKYKTATSGDNYIEDKVATFIADAQTWDANKIYHYKFGISMPQVLNQKPIVFGEPEIAVWDTTEGGASLSNKEETPVP